MEHSVFEKKSVMIVTALFCCLLWGSAFPCIKLSYAEFGIQNEFQKIFFAGMRFTLAGVGVLIFAKLKRKTKLLPKPKEMPFILLIALLQTFGAYLLYYVGLGHVTAVKASVISSSSVFMVVIIAHYVFKTDKVNWKKSIGLLSGFAGVVMVNLTLFSNASFSFSLMGEGFIAFNSMFCAVSTVLVRKYASKMDMFRLNGWQLFIGGLLLLIVGYTGYPKMIVFNVVSSMLLVYLTAISAVAFTFWFILLKHHNASTVEQYKFAVPLFGSLMAVIFVPGEQFGLEMLVSALLVAIGIIIVNRQDIRGVKNRN